ncbi:hypothetical protein KCTCHS21_11910 [Cohnella abietis]|uniref:Uncharacterized protein n=1 Tax=Cohnella abietis TaxID=2507935 RepID=A0A3T1D103_9BACL|nr:hypothetical protein KCTCHS21_11910 [Cohnella abietis]
MRKFLRNSSFGKTEALLLAKANELREQGKGGRASDENIVLIVGISEIEYPLFRDMGSSAGAGFDSKGRGC